MKPIGKPSRKHEDAEFQGLARIEEVGENQTVKKVESGRAHLPYAVGLALACFAMGLASGTLLKQSPQQVVPAVFPSLPIPCRDDLAIVAQKHFAKNGVAAEIGVFEGGFAAKNLRHWQGTYWMIDAWAYRPNDPADKNFKNSRANDFFYNRAVQATSFAGARRHLLRNLSLPSAARFEDGFFDWVYIDALHTREALLKDLAAWYPKVRPGGLVSGDDYGEKDDTDLCTSDRWAKFFSLTVAKGNEWGVISAVNDFTRVRGIQVHITWMTDCYKYPAWYFVKPNK